MIITEVHVLICRCDDGGVDLCRCPGYSCFVNGRVYQHGEVFTLESSRCIKYRCAYGNYDFYEEGVWKETLD